MAHLNSEFSSDGLALSESGGVSRSASGACIPANLSADLLSRLAQLARQHGMSLFSILLSSWTALLARWSGLESMVIQVRAASGLSDSEQNNIVENVVVLPVQVQQDTTTLELLKHVEGTCVQQGWQPERAPAPAAGYWNCSVSQITIWPMPATIIISTDLPLHGWYSDKASDERARLELLMRGQGDFIGIQVYVDSHPREVLERMMASWTVLLDAIVTDVRQVVGRLPMVTAAERELVVHAFNDTARRYPDDRLIHELFEEQVERTPDAIALIYEQQSLTYAELNIRANQLARYLLSQGVVSEQLVGLYVERSLEMVIGLLGILKAGAAYLPLDPSYPDERLAYILRDAAPSLLLTQERLRGVLSAASAKVITLHGDCREISRQQAANLDPCLFQLTPGQLAYVIYTSGSTGRPKGVSGEHRGIVNRIAAQQTIYPFTNDDICYQKTSIGFIDSIFEMLGPLSYGCPLVIASPAVGADVKQLASTLEKHRVTRLVTVPCLAQSLVDHDQLERLQSLRSWTLSGEELPRELLRKLHQLLPQCTFINLYGSSEVAADVTAYVSTSTGNGRVPIGRPIQNMQIYILNCHRQLVPVGVIGEIYVAGAGVARGYLHQPELTAERFVSNPFSADPRTRMFKTGDIGRWRKDGMIEYFGRNDHQVKIRGFRIELEEIEAHLMRHSGVKNAIVTAREDVPGEKCLVAYVVPNNSSNAAGPPSPNVLRTYLKSMLPSYMLPSAFVILEQFPLTPSGKLNRLALPAPRSADYVSADYQLPQGEVEASLAGIWQSLLRVARVGREDNFFELGGHSILAIKLAAAISESWTIEYPFVAVYEHPTIRQMAQMIKELAVKGLRSGVVPEAEYEEGII